MPSSSDCGRSCCGQRFFEPSTIRSWSLRVRYIQGGLRGTGYFSNHSREASCTLLPEGDAGRCGQVNRARINSKLQTGRGFALPRRAGRLTGEPAADELQRPTGLAVEVQAVAQVAIQADVAADLAAGHEERLHRYGASGTDCSQRAKYLIPRHPPSTGGTAVRLADVKVAELCSGGDDGRSEEHTSELQSPCNLVCRLLL